MSAPAAAQGRAPVAPLRRAGTLAVALLAAGGIGVAVLVQWYVIRTLGPGPETDALFAAMTVPTVATAVVAGSVASVLVPMLSSSSARAFDAQVWTMACLVTLPFVVVWMLLHAGAPVWVPLTVPGFPEDTAALTVRLARIQLPGMAITAFTAVQWAACRARGRFAWAEAGPLLAAGASLAALVWALPRYGVEAAAWLALGRVALTALLLAPAMGRPSRPCLRDATARTVWTRVRPLLLGATYYKTDPLVDRFLLSSSPSGTLSTFLLAQQACTAFAHVFARAVAGPLLVTLSRAESGREREAFWNAYRSSVTVALVASVSGALVLAGLAAAVRTLLVEHARFSPETATLLCVVLVALSGQIVCSSLGSVMTAAFHARGDTSSPTRAGALAYTFGIPLKAGGYWAFGVTGLAIGISAYHVIAYVLMQREIRKLHDPEVEV